MSDHSTYNGYSEQGTENELLSASVDGSLECLYADSLTDSVATQYYGVTTLKYGYKLNSPGVPISQYTRKHGVSKYKKAFKNIFPVKASTGPKEIMPVDQVGLFSDIFFLWITKYIIQAMRKRLTPVGIPSCTTQESAEHNGQRLENIWREEVTHRGQKGASLFRVMWRFVRTRVIVAWIILICGLIVGMMSSMLFVRGIISVLDNNKHGTLCNSTLPSSRNESNVTFIDNNQLSRNISIGTFDALDNNIQSLSRNESNEKVHNNSRLLPSNGSNEDNIEKILFSLGLVLTELFSVLLLSWTWSVNYRTATRLRSACFSMIYAKVVRLTMLKQKSVKELMDVFENDGQKIFDAVIYGPFIIAGPIVSISGLVFIWMACKGELRLIGMLLILLFYPIQYLLSILVVYLKNKIAVISEQRMDKINEMLQFLYHIKLQCWELPFVKSIKKIRRNQSKLTEKANFCQSFIVTMALTLPIIALLLTFSTPEREHLTAIQVFPVLAFFLNQMRTSFIGFYEGISNTLNALPALRRMKNIMSLIEKNHILYIEKPIDKSLALCISNGTFTWTSNSTKGKQKKDLSHIWNRHSWFFSSPDNEGRPQSKSLYLQSPTAYTLTDINIAIAKGQLVGICGDPGSGKTSLLRAVLGHLRLVKGQMGLDGSIAYVDQHPWVMNDTLRQNILFHDAFDARSLIDARIWYSVMAQQLRKQCSNVFRYYNAIKDCALSNDIYILPQGDATEIGNQNIKLTEAQKQRIALARALYSNKDLYLLDDPLCFMEHSTAMHVFEKAILNALVGKTVIIACNDIGVLNRCDGIFFIKNGKIIESGSHETLMGYNGEYALKIRQLIQDSQEHELDDVATVENLTDSVFTLSPPVVSGNTSTASQVGIEDDDVLMNVQGGTESVSMQTYHTYIQMAGGYFIILLLLLMFLFHVGSAPVILYLAAEFNFTHNGRPMILDHHILIVIAIAVIWVASLFRRSVHTKVTVRAANKLHSKLLKTVMRTPLTLCNSLQISSIQNLFSRDMQEIDSSLPLSADIFLQNLWVVIFVILIIIYLSIWLAIPLLALMLISAVCTNVFRSSVSTFKAIQFHTLTPIYKHILSTVDGLSTINTFGKGTDFFRRFCSLLDDNTSIFYLSSLAMRWLAIRIELFAVLNSYIVIFLTVFFREDVMTFPDIHVVAKIGLLLAFSLQVGNTFHYSIKSLCEIESKFFPVERIEYYIQEQDTENEPEHTIKVPKNWPTGGHIVFENVSVQNTVSPRGISFSIEAGEKIGVVGGVESGKDFISLALLGLTDINPGTITIDGVDTSKIKLEQLHSKIASIPKDVILFPGTIRYNLDPFEQKTDNEIWEILEKARMKQKVMQLSQKLNYKIVQNSETFSVGEIQLLCLLRAYLGNYKIILFEEGADVSSEIQDTTSYIINQFTNSTVITTTKHLKSIIGYDRVIVMEGGQVIENDEPIKLLKKPGSLFASFVVKDDGIQETAL